MRKMIEVKVPVTCMAGMELIDNRVKGANVIFNVNSRTGRVECFLDNPDGITDEQKIGFVTLIVNENGENETLDSLKEDLLSDYIATTCNVSGRNLIIEFNSQNSQFEEFAQPAIGNNNDGTTHVKSLSLSQNVQDAVKRTIDENILTKEEADAILEYLTSERYTRIPVPNELVVKLFNQMQKWDVPVPTPKSKFIDRYKSEPLYKDISIVTVCLIKALNHQATIYQGDKSVGKNVMAETIFWLMHVPYGKTTFNEKMTPDDLTGARTTAASEVSAFSDEDAKRSIELENADLDKLSEDDKTLVMSWKLAKARSQTPSITVEKTPIIDAIRYGYGFIADEINHGNANLIGSMNGLLDGSKTFETASIGKVEINPGFVLIGTQNAGSKYTATNRLDAATLSRVSIVEFPYSNSILDILEEAVLSETKERLKKEYFKACDAFYMDVCKLFKQGAMSDAAMNVRGIVAALNETASVSVGSSKFIPAIPLKMSMKTCVINSCIEDKDNVLLTGLINQHFANL